MPHCPNCGNELLEYAKFCPACGQPATQTVPAPKPFAERTAASLPLGEYLKTGWRLFLNYPAGFIGFFLVYLVIQAALYPIPYMGNIAAFAVGPALIMGNFIVCAKLLQNHPPQFSDFFLGFRFFVPLLLTSLVGGVLTAVGFLLLVIPGVYLAVAYIFAHSLVVDRRLDFWPALETSRRTVNPIWFGMFGFCLLLVLVNIAGAIALGIGLLVTIPVTMCAVTTAYADIFGLKSDYSEGFPDNVPAGTTTPAE
ncbi:MAG: zinc-ribbon domain-containing protein [Deltaproteobacteria bacterium]|nr:zinc-ribbon domain-containing protein [Deltaproteobacteria bacterium]